MLINKKQFSEEVDNDDINKIFDDFRKKPKRKSELDYSNYLGLNVVSQTLPTDIEESLLNQSRTLDRKKRHDLNSGKISKFIAKKINKQEKNAG